MSNDMLLGKSGAKAGGRYSSPTYFKGLNWLPKDDIGTVLFILCHCVTVRVNYSMNQ